MHEADLLLCRTGGGGWFGKIIGVITEGTDFAVYTYFAKAYQTPLETAYVLCYKSGVPG